MLERRIRADFDEAQFGFMPGKGTIDALFLVRRLQEEHREKDKRMYMCFVELEKAFDRVPRRVMQWAMRKKRLPEILVKAVTSLYEGAEKKLELDWVCRKNFLGKLVYTNDLCCHLCCLQW